MFSNGKRTNKNMTELVFDTHNSVARLKKAGMQENQAETIVAVIHEACAMGHVNLVTKADMYKALWLQTGAIFAMLLAAIGLVVTLLQG